MIHKDNEFDYIKIPIEKCKGLQIMKDDLYVIDQNNSVIVYDISEIKNIKCRNFDEEKFDFTELFKEMDIVKDDKDNLINSNKNNNQIIDEKPIDKIKIISKGNLNFDSNKVTQISAGLNHILFLCDNGAVYALGEDTNGQCGQGRQTSDSTYRSIKPAHLDKPMLVKRLPVISQVSAGSTHSLFLTPEGIVFGCGMNNH